MECDYFEAPLHIEMHVHTSNLNTERGCLLLVQVPVYHVEEAEAWFTRAHKWAVVLVTHAIDGRAREGGSSLSEIDR